MSSQDLSSILDPSSRSLTPAPDDGQRTPATRAPSPAGRNEDTAAMLAWRNARDAYRKSLPDKDFKRIMVPAGPDDVLKEIKKWQSGQRKSKYCRVADGIQAGISRLQQFNRAVDMIAQGSPAPGCLVWGSIIFVLTIVQKAAEEYSKLCKALTRMIECLPRVELYTKTFLDSRLVQDSVTAFYSSVLRFWTRACKFYRRNRLWNFVRVIWNDYDVEFGELESEMVRCQQQIQESAQAEHFGDSKTGRIQQQTVNTVLLDAQTSSRRKEIIAWLAPTGYAVDYYTDDFMNAKMARHANTCQWILERDPFPEFDRVTHSGGSLLWIYAQPGAGKTVLAAFLVDYFGLNQQSACVLYFFCKDTDDDKRTSVAVARSLLYQLFRALRERDRVSALAEDLSLAMDESGHKTALNFATVWKIFSNHASGVSPVTIVIDALDECRDSHVLIQSLQSIGISYNVRVILTSRKEEHLYQLLHQGHSLEISPDDIDSDIKAFVEAKVTASPRLSQPSVNRLVVQRLCESHQGMFLWVQYMIKELKSCVSLQQVEEELRELPRGLDALYQRILQRLEETLDKQTFKLCSKVLTWVTTSLRPLRIDELRQALEADYLSEGHSLLTADGSFPYSDKDIELVCGSLVTVRNETLQVVHLTVKQYITYGSSRTTLDLLAETKDANLKLTLGCLSFLKHICAKPISDLSPKRPVEAEEDELDLSLLRSRTPFLEYACFSWLVHLVDCTSTEALQISKFLYSTFNSPSTFGWIESCMALQPGNVRLLQLGLNDVRNWIESFRSDGTIADDPNFLFVSSWCTAMEEVLEEYGSVLKQRSTEIYYLDLASTFGAHSLTDTYEEYGGLTRREKCSRFATTGVQRMAVPQNRRLSLKALGIAVPGLFIYEPNRDIFIYSSRVIHYGDPVLLTQSASNGKTLPSISSSQVWSDTLYLISVERYDICENGRYLGIVHSYDEGRLLITIWEIDMALDFTRRMRASSWARLVHRCTIDERSIASLWFRSGSCFGFDQDGVYFPNGLVRTVSGTNPFIEDIPYQRLIENILLDRLDASSLWYSKNGKFLFVSTAREITKYSTSGLKTHFKLSSSDRQGYLSAISPSGRYFACTSNPDKVQIDSWLVDTLTGSTIVLPFPDKTDDIEKQTLSIEGGEFITCYICYNSESSTTLHIYYFTGLPNNVSLRASGKFKFDGLPSSSILHVCYDHRIVHLVRSRGEFQRIALGDEIKVLDAPEKDAPEDTNKYAFRADFISQDGTRWARVNLFNDKAQIQYRSMLSPDEIPRCIELHRTTCRNETYFTNMTMSMDLSILILDEDIYNLGDSKTGEISIKPQGLKLPVGLSSQRDTMGRNWCLVDASNSYVAYLTRYRIKSEDRIPEHPDDLLLFRINSDWTSLSQLQPFLPDDMFETSIQFHSSSPLLVVGYGLISEGRSTGLTQDGDQIPYHVLIINMNTMSQSVVDFKQNPGICLDGRYMLPYFNTRNVGFSSSGDFAYTESRSDSRRKYQIIKDSFKVSPRSFRYIERCLATDGAFYELDFSGNGTLQLALIKPEFTKWDVAKHRVCLPNLAHISSYYYERSYSNTFLLLGKTDEDYMQILVAPRDDRAPVLKTILLTWREARVMLNRKWEEKYGHLISDRAASSEDVHVPEEEPERESTDLQRLSIAPSI